MLDPVTQSLLEGPAYNLIMLVVTVATIFAAFIPFRRRRQLTISSPRPVPVPGGTEVTRDGQALAAPYTAKVSVQNTGWRQISCGWLEFDIKAAIAGVEANLEQRGGSRPAVHQVTGSTIRLKSFVLNRGERIVVEMSTDGEPDLAGAATFSEDLHGTDITYRRVDTRVRRLGFSRPRRLALGALLVVLATLSGFALLLRGSDGPAISVSPGQGPAGTEVTVTGQNFGRLEALDIRLGDQPATRAQADEQGRFTVRFKVPANARHGTNVIVAASGNPGGSMASTEFVVAVSSG